MEQREITCIGIEATAHTFGVSVASSNGQIFCDAKRMHKPPLGKGIHPREAAQHHSTYASEILSSALREYGKPTKTIDAIAFSMGPGLGPCLRTGATVARTLSYSLGKPLVPVHHAIAHIEIAKLATGSKDPLAVLVSGGHTNICAFSDHYWRIYGETEDITLGNLIDGFAREAGLPSPGGPVVEELAKKGNNFIALPYAVKGNDVSYSGLLTALGSKLLKKIDVSDLCYSLQEVAFAMLTEATERALAHTEKREVLLAGGVAANNRLQEMLKQIAEEHGADFYVVPLKFSGDCGAQIAWTGAQLYIKGVRVEIENSFVKPRWRMDSVYIP
jgi:N6-L-threonylcarbamoyladenine synthase